MMQDKLPTSLDELYEKAVQLGVHWMKTGTQYPELRDCVNKCMELSHANSGINEECTIGRRRLVSQRIVIRSIRFLNSSELDKLQGELYRISSEDVPRKPFTENKTRPRRRI